VSAAVEAFVDRVALDLKTQCPMDTLLYLADDKKVQQELRSFASEAKIGLDAVVAGTGTVEALVTRLRARKTLAIQTARQNHYTLEKLIGQALAKLEEEAKRLEKEKAKKQP
jgi:hypothetical protein